MSKKHLYDIKDRIIYPDEITTFRRVVLIARYVRFYNLLFLLRGDNCDRPLLYFEIFDNQHGYDKILVSVSWTHFSF